MYWFYDVDKDEVRKVRNLFRTFQVNIKDEKFYFCSCLNTGVEDLISRDLLKILKKILRDYLSQLGKIKTQ